MADLPRVIVIFGPTASGKTAAALRLAGEMGGEIINADSRQLYAKMPILSACPSSADYKTAPHHLFEVFDPKERVSSAQWAALASAKIEEIVARGKVPIVVGGTGFYLRTLMEGVSEIPQAPPEIEAELKGLPVRVLYKELREVDPVLAESLKSTDTQRITRGLVVWRHTGKPLSEWQEGEKKPAPYEFIKYATSHAREVMHDRIGVRWQQMVDAGVLDEAKALRDAGYTLDMPGMTCLGLKEMYAFMDGAMEWDEVGERVVAGTRQYAKRQVTWLRNTYWDIGVQIIR